MYVQSVVPAWIVWLEGLANSLWSSKYMIEFSSWVLLAKPFASPHPSLWDCYTFLELSVIVFWFFCRDLAEVEAEQKMLEAVCIHLSAIWLSCKIRVFFLTIKLMGIWILLQALKNARERDRRILLRAVSSCTAVLDLNICVSFCQVKKNFKCFFILFAIDLYQLLF